MPTISATAAASSQ